MKSKPQEVTDVRESIQMRGIDYYFYLNSPSALSHIVSGTVALAVYLVSMYLFRQVYDPAITEEVALRRLVLISQILCTLCSLFIVARSYYRAYDRFCTNRHLRKEQNRYIADGE